MKKILIVLLTVISFSASAQLHLSSKITSVKVFQQSAEITRQLSVDLTAGTQEIVLKDLSTLITPSSLQVLMNGKYTSLLSAKFETNYLVPNTNTPEVVALYKERDEKQSEFDWINEQVQVLNGMEEILKKNQNLGGTTSGFSAAQVIELVNSYKVKSIEIRKEKRDLIKKQQKLNQDISNLNQQLNQLNGQLNKPSGNIVLMVDSKSAEKVQITCIYNVNNAGWTPLYDLRSNGIEENVVLKYKANVWQQSGIEWKDVNVIISTGNPLQNNNRPVLNPLYANIFHEMLNRSKALSVAPAESNMMYDYALEKGKDAWAYNAGVNVNQLNIEFVVANKQTIQSDRKENLLALKSYELPTEYVYHAVPKLNKGAFLLAKVSDWGQYNLIAGEANIFFEGAFIGKSNINPEVASDTLLISMGRDNGISIERKAVKDFTETNFIGTKKEETFGYEITVLNKKTIAINIEILDQIPVSQNELIEVKLEEKGSAKYTKEIGKLLWSFTIPPGQSTTERFVYSVRYPKKERVTGIK